MSGSGKMAAHVNILLALVGVIVLLSALLQSPDCSVSSDQSQTREHILVPIETQGE
jgi:hypothetical protein